MSKKHAECIGYGPIAWGGKGGRYISPDHRKKEHGFALLLVLWSLALLSIVLLHVTAIGRSEAQIANNLRSELVAEAAADGAVYAALLNAIGGASRGWRPDGSVHVMRLGRAMVNVKIVDEAGKVDPNVAPVQLLKALLQACGAAPARAARVAAAIFDWHTPNIGATDGGGKAQEYRQAGRDYGPPDTKFSNVDELQLVLGMTPDLFACLAPHISVNTAAIPEPGLADPVVREAIGIMYREDVDTVATAALHRASVIRITTTAIALGSRFSRSAVVRVANLQPGGPAYRVLAWE